MGKWFKRRIKGYYHYKNGEYYLGYWKKDLRHGHGKLYNENGKIIYEGNWINDRMEKNKEEEESVEDWKKGKEGEEFVNNFDIWLNKISQRLERIDFEIRLNKISQNLDQIEQELKYQYPFPIQQVNNNNQPSYYNQPVNPKPSKNL